ncbi:Protein FAR1-RELATED SEQUENCE 5 [Bienertia sinuspersici]
MQESGLRPIEQYRYMITEAGGEAENEANEGGDAQAVIDKLYQNMSDDLEFFFRVRVDGCGRVSSIFWRDSMMKEDYNIYGDVTIFDTTYRTNRYNLICAPFTGINNHWNNIMFGCAFLGDEKMESFVWLFETFKKAIGDKYPTTIFTDQDTAMTKAIEKDASCKDALLKCLSGCSSKEEFEKTWHKMITKYNLEKSKWFSRLYALKKKWATT